MDFSSMDNSNYMNALNSYTSSFNTVNDELNKARAKAQEKIDTFNQALQQPLQIVGAPLIAKGIGKTFGRIRSALTEKIGQKADELTDTIRNKAGELYDQATRTAEEVADGAKATADDLVSTAKPLSEAGQLLPSNPSRGEMETNLDEALARQGEAREAFESGKISLQQESNEAFESIFNPTEKLDEFSADLIPAGARGRINLSTPIDESGALKDAVGDLSSQVSEGATNTAVNALKSSVGKLGEDAGLSDALEASTAVAGSEGFLNPIADLAPIGLGLGLVFTGLFSKKSAPHIAPPPSINPSATFGI